MGKMNSTRAQLNFLQKKEKVVCWL